VVKTVRDAVAAVVVEEEVIVRADIVVAMLVVRVRKVVRLVSLRRSSVVDSVVAVVHLLRPRSG
jgi:hypothetical protein